jgi:RHS repeat-associated protein
MSSLAQRFLFLFALVLLGLMGPGCGSSAIENEAARFFLPKIDIFKAAVDQDSSTGEIPVWWGIKYRYWKPAGDPGYYIGATNPAVPNWSASAARGAFLKLNVTGGWTRFPVGDNIFSVTGRLGSPERDEALDESSARIELDLFYHLSRQEEDDSPPCNDPDCSKWNPLGFNAVRDPGKKNGKKGSHGDPIDVATGALLVTETDAQYPSPSMPFLSVRNYDSSKHALADSLFGEGWSWSYGWRGSSQNTARIEWIQQSRSVGPIFETWIEQKFVYARRRVEISSLGFRRKEVLKKFSPLPVEPLDEDGNIFFEGGNGYRRSYSQGRLVTIRNANGSRISLHYSSSASRVPNRIVDTAGREVLLTEVSGRVGSMTLPNGDTWTYQYSGGLLTSVTSPSGGVTQYTYDPVSRKMTSKTLPTGEVRKWTYNQDDKVTSVVNEGGLETLIRYGGDAEPGHTISFTDAGGATTSYLVDIDKQIVKTTKPSGAVTLKEVRPTGFVTAVVDPLGRRTEYTGGAGLVAEMTGPTGAYTRWWRGALGRAHRRDNPDGTFETASFDANGNPLTVTDASGNTTSNTYDQYGQLITTTNPEGMTTTFVRDAHGNIVQIVDPAGAITTLTYDIIGRLLSITDPLLNKTQFEYREGLQISKIRRPDGLEIFRTFDAAGNVISETNAAGATTTFLWRNIDGSYVLAKQVDPLGAETTFEYDSAGRNIAVVDGLGARTTIERDANGRIVSVTDPESNVRQVGYNLDGTVAFRIGPSGAQTNLEYDELGRLKKVIRPEGGFQSLFYDQLDRLVQIRDDLNRSTFYNRDAGGRIDSIRHPNETFTRFVYDSRGLVVETLEPGNRKTEWIYDVNGRMIEEKDSVGAITKYTRDSAGRVTAVEDPEGRVRHFEYDSLGRIVRTVDSAGNATNFTYSPHGKIASATDGNGQLWEFQYDQLGRLITSTNPLGHSIHREYDAVSNLTRVIDEIGSETRFEWSPRRLLAKEIDASGKAVQYSYDASGRKIEKINARGDRVGFTYDQEGRVVSISRGASSDSFSYDTAGRLVLAAGGIGAMSFSYDSMDRVISQVDLRGFYAGFGYDDANNQIARIDSHSEATTRKFDEVGRPTTVTIPGSGSWSISYNLAGQETERRGPDGSVIGRSYDIAGRLKRIQLLTGSPPDLKLAYDYEYDLAGNLTKQVLHKPGGVEVETLFEYDAKSQLIAANVLTPGGEAHVGFKSITYTYDPAGNRLTRTKDGITDSYQYNNLNQITSKNGLPFSYDDDGNLVQEMLNPTTLRSYTYDAQNRLTSTEMLEISGGASPAKTRFEYDTLGLAGRITSLPTLTDPNIEVRDRFWSLGVVTEEVTRDQASTLENGDWRRYSRLGSSLLEDAYSTSLNGDLTKASVSRFTIDRQGSPVFIRKEREATGIDGFLELVDDFPGGSIADVDAYEETMKFDMSGDGKLLVVQTVDPFGLVGEGGGFADELFLRSRETGTTTLIPVSTEIDDYGRPALAISANGKFVTYVSYGEDEQTYDWLKGVYLQNIETGATTLVSRRKPGADPGASTEDTTWPDISEDGRRVAFLSADTELDADVPPDFATNQVYLYDNFSGEISLMSSNTSGGGAPVVAATGAEDVEISGDGLFVGFLSTSANLDSITSRYYDLFGGERLLYVRDVASGQCEIMNLAANGRAPGGHDIEMFSISRFGRYVTFTTRAAMVPQDTNGTFDVYIRDRIGGTVTRVSVGEGNLQGNDDSFAGSVSEDGRFVAFLSKATNLDGIDTNNAIDLFVWSRLDNKVMRMDVGLDSPTTVTGRFGYQYVQTRRLPVVDLVEGMQGIYDITPRISEDGSTVAFQMFVTHVPVGGGEEKTTNHVWVVSNPHMTGGGGGVEIQENFVQYTPFGEVASAPEDLLFGFQGLSRVPLSVNPVDELLSAQYRNARPGIGRWLRRDPGGLIDGPNRYRWNRNNPLRYRDPNGLFAVPTIYFGGAALAGAVAQTAYDYKNGGASLWSPVVGAGKGFAAGVVALPAVATALAGASPGTLVAGVELLTQTPWILGGTGGLIAKSQIDAAAARAEADYARRDAARAAAQVPKSCPVKANGPGFGNIGSHDPMASDDALSLGEKWLGPGYKEIGPTNSGIFRSSDGLRQFRMRESDLTFQPNARFSTPHVHFEAFVPGRRKAVENLHIEIY